MNVIEGFFAPIKAEWKKKKNVAFAIIAVAIMCAMPVLTILTSIDSFAAEPYDASGELIYDYSGTMATVKGMDHSDNGIAFKLNIPSTVTKDEITYTVAAIKENAFENITSLRSVGMPANVTTIGNNAFKGCTSLTSVSMSGVTTIGSNAFEGCTSLTSVGMQAAVTTIENNAFEGCTSLTSVKMPDTVTTIGNNAFEGCTSLGTVEIPSSVTIIKESTFKDCSSLKSVDIHDGITTIEENAFKNCKSLEWAEIPSSVTTIGDGAFAGCTSLEEMVVAKENNTFSSMDGVLYNISQTELICCPGGKTNCKNIPDTVTSIRWYAFEGCTSLKKVEIPSSVTKIENYTFLDCKSLTSVWMSDMTTVIGPYAFKGCTSLKLDSLPFNLITIGEHAFDGCTSIKSITIPNTVTTIGDGAFDGCTSLETIKVGDLNKDFSSVDGVLYNLDKSKLIRYPEGLMTTYFFEEKILSIEKGAFKGCKYSGFLIFENNVTTIGESAFEGCAYLESIDIPGSVATIGNNAFKGCTSLKSMDTHATATIGESAFEGCTSLSAANMSNISTIGNCAFKGCTSLTTLEIKQNNVTIGDYAFAGCTSLTTVNIPPENITIGQYAFAGCTFLKSLLIKYTASIEEGTFKGCTSLKSVDIGAVTSIGDYAFAGCTSLEWIGIPRLVATIGDYAFEGCASLKEIFVEPENEKYSSVDGVLYDKGKTKLICCPGGKTSCENIPNTVTSIEDSAFKGCTSLSTIKIPNTIESIGKSAFEGCTSMTSVLMLGNTAMGEGAFKGCTSLDIAYMPIVKTIEKYAFAGCTSLDVVNAPEVETIKESAFEGCTSLTTVEMTNVKTIEKKAFYDCMSLISAGMLKIITIEESAFEGCTSLTTVEVPENDGFTISKCAFYDCVSLVEINLINVTSIEESAFSGCMSLTKIIVSADNGQYSSDDGALYDKDKKKLICCPGGKTSLALPTSVTNIETYAFDSCTSLKEITMKTGNGNGTYTTDDGVLYDGTGETLIYCPEGKERCTIPNTVKNISPNAFHSNENLNDITFPTSLTYISKDAFGFKFYKDGKTEITDYGDLLGHNFRTSSSGGRMTETAKVAFDSDGGSAVGDRRVCIGDTTVLPTSAQCTKYGYELKGWTYNGRTYSPGEDVVINYDVLFKAKWEVKYVTVIFDSDGGSSVQPQQVKQGECITKPATPTKTGYEFVGWYNGDTKWDFSMIVNESMVLKAVWKEPGSVEVTFDSEGGSGVPPQYVMPGKCATEPATPTKTGYTFVGWYNGDTKWNFSTPVTENVTLKAKWEVKYVTVIFDSDGGSPVSPQNVKEGGYATEPATPTKTGYTFVGWYNGATIWDFNTPVTENMTLTAVWKEPGSVEVAFDSDGGSGVPPQYVKKGEYAEEPETPTKTGYTFVGWYNGDTKWDFNMPVTEKMTLKAKWGKDAGMVTVTFVSVGEVCASQVLEKGQKATEPPIYRFGYMFVGWYCGNELWVFDTPVNADMALTARWEEIKEQIKVETDYNGNAEITIPVGYDIKSLTIENALMNITLPAETLKTLEGKTLYVSIRSPNAYAINQVCDGNTATNAEDVFEVIMKVGNEDFKGKATFQIPFDSKKTTNPSVYIRTGSGDELIESTLKDGVICFDAEQGGTFVVKYTITPEPVPADNNNFTLFWIALLTVAIIVGCIGAYVIVKRH